MTYKYFKDESRKNWCTRRPDDQGEAWNISPDQAKFGAILRIADACELMAKNHDELVLQRDLFRDALQEKITAIIGLERKIAALRGVITKMKKERAK